MKTIVKFAIMALLIVSCSSEDSNNSNQNYKISTLRANLTENKTISEIKEKYSSIVSEDKISVWQDKLEQLKSLDLPSENLILINELSKELKNYNVSKEIDGINAIAKSLANITPIEDYVKMFASLENYQFTDKFEGSAMAIDYFDSFEVKNDFEFKLESSTSKRPDCNCRWTCGEVSGSHSNCNETSIGCGFLWLGSCTGKY